MISAKNSSRQRQVLSQLARAIEFDSLTLSNDQIAMSDSAVAAVLRVEEAFIACEAVAKNRTAHNAILLTCSDENCGFVM